MSKIRTLGLLAAVAVFAAVFLPRIEPAGSTSSVDDGRREATDAIEACVGKGISYHQQVGSFPKLSTGQNAVDASRERCRRNPKAFD